MPERAPARHSGPYGTYSTTLASRKRALELGAAFIEADLAKLRHDVAAGEAAQVSFDMNRPTADNPEGERPYTRPVSTSHEADVMKAMEWASASATLRVLASLEDS